MRTYAGGRATPAGDVNPRAGRRHRYEAHRHHRLDATGGLVRSSVAFLFPGQGAKRVFDVLRGVVRRERGRARCEFAARAADVPLLHLMRLPSLLDRTEVLQPVLTAIVLAIADVLAEAGIQPTIVAGHSLGEIAAWSVAGGISA